MIEVFAIVGDKIGIYPWWENHNLKKIEEIFALLTVEVKIGIVGSVPVVIGAPNIQDFAPSPGSILHIKELKDAEPVAKTMKYLAEHPEEYNQSLR